MKKLIVGLVAVLTLGAFNASAQNGKIAHIDYLAVTDSLPSKIKADKEIEAYVKEEQAILKELETQFQRDYEIYLNDRENLSKVMQGMREESLGQRQQDIQIKTQKLQQDVQTLSGRLYKPIEDNLNKAVEIVAKKHNIAYVLDKGQTLYAGGQDLTDEVTAEMLKMEKQP
jgi:Skp family chaperone for outer membrane proteins